MSQVNKTPEGRWKARVKKAGYKFQSKTFDTKSEAERWERTVKSQMDTGFQVVNHVEAKSITVGSLFQRYLDEQVIPKKLSKSEINTIKRVLREVKFMHRRLSQFKPTDIREWRDFRLTQVSPATVNREFTSISSVLTHSIKEWEMPLLANPAFLVTRPKGADVERDFRWTDEDIQKVLKQLQWKESVTPSSVKEYVGWTFLLALETAMRVGEISSLTVADFVPEGRYCYLKKTKNGDERYVPLSKTALKYFKFLTKGKAPEEMIFPPSGTLGPYFREAKLAVGLAHLHFHDTRHEAATRLSKKFNNVLELSAMTGHRSLKSLKRYYNPTPLEIASRLD